MVNKYSVSIVNQSGSDQNYFIFSELPKITGTVQGQIWSNVLDTAETPVDQKATFQVYKQYFATCGNSHGKPADGVTVNVRGFIPVDLGTKKDDGTPQPGTTLNLTVKKDAPYFDPVTPPSSAYQNAFRINTKPDFSNSDARQNNFMIGLGGSTGAGNSLPAAVFTPQPNVSYQIQPVNTYYIAYGDYEPGALIDVDMIGSTVKVDFAHSSSSNIIIVHNECGVLVTQAA